MDYCNQLEQYYTAEDVAGMLKIPLTSVWYHIRNGKLKAIRIGKKYRISQAQIDDFISICEQA